jgi:hypothetical protein
MQQRVGSRLSAPVRDRIVELAASDFGPTEIARTLDEEFPKAVPSLRTIQGIVSDERKRRGEPWSMYDSDPADLALVLPVLRAGIEWTRGQIRGISQPQADRIVRIVRAAPDIPAEVAFRLGLSGQKTGAIEAYLAYAPWRDAGGAYIAAFRRRWIGPLIAIGFLFDPFSLDPTEGDQKA